MDSEPRSRFTAFRISLRTRFALGIAVPLLLVISSLAVLHYWRGRQLIEEEIRLSSFQLGEALLGSLRPAMLINDSEMLADALSSVGGMENIRTVQIIDLDGRVRAHSHSSQVGKTRRLDETGCTECHAFPSKDRPRTTKLHTAVGTLRISTPIANEPDCMGCHVEEGAHLGVLLADISLADTQKHLFDDLRIDLLFGAGTTVAAIFGLYFLIHRLVVRRMLALRAPLRKFAAGDFSTRLPVSAGPGDELDQLARTLNHMADELERSAREQEERGKLRQRTIIEERERIARELHDGLAQLLGYVNTKAMAVRLMLKNEQTEAADRNLLQLEEAARELFVDVREAILDLKMAGKVDVSLPDTLGDFVAQFSRLSGVSVGLKLAPAVENLSLTVESTQQLLRIIQESLTNVRKHASATNVWVSIEIDDGFLELTVGDDGEGFSPDYIENDRRPHFGLSTMRERAEIIGAEFDVESELGTGTRVIVRLPFKDLSCSTEVFHKARSKDLS